MSQPFRLASGGAIDRAWPLDFRFDGRALTGFAGDTVASALLANGVHLVARSFKERRPRGIVSAGLEEPNALVAIGRGGRTTPSVRATREPLADGLEVRSQHGFPSLRFDLLAALGLFHPLLPAGFYNKTFFLPNWEAHEPVIRRLAGLGTPPAERDPARYERRNAHCDLLVVGGGAAGLVAALTAARSGARVLLVGSGGEWGGALRDREVPVGTHSPRDWIAALAGELATLPNVTLLSRTTVVGAYDHGVFAALEECAAGSPVRERWWRIRARRALVAAGAHEQPLVFPDNDRPGILLASAAAIYARRFAAAVGRRVAVITNDDSAYAAALALRASSVEVVCVADLRGEVDPVLLRPLGAVSIESIPGVSVVGTRGRARVSAVELATSDGRRRRIACDALALSGGWNPAAQLVGQAGGKLTFDPALQAFVPRSRAGVLEAIGAAAGRFELRAALADSVERAREAAAELGFAAAVDDSLLGAVAAERSRRPVGPIGCSSERGRAHAFVDLAHDVTAADIDLAAREGLRSVEHVKRYTTVGMAIDQGKTSNRNAIAILGAATDREPGQVGTTKFRPPVVPVTLGAIAGGRIGRFLRPTRLLPSHDAQLAAGAVMEDFGLWRRPAYYPLPGESRERAVEREMLLVRRGVGLFEASPLGKLLVRGPDAARLLEFVSATPIADLPVGRIRYGLMLTEKGIVLDDGVTLRLGAEEFWVGTSSGNALRVAALLEEWRACQFPDWRVAITDLTSAWATLAVAGPRAREVVAALDSGIDLAPAAFPHMHLRRARLRGAEGDVPLQIARVSFTGELTYELSVPAEFGTALWDALLEAGRPLGLAPFGVDALLALRIEKGYLHVGADTDGTTVPDDIGMGALLAKKRDDFVGRRSLTLPEHLRGDRFQLVGLRLEGDSDPFVAGAHLVDRDGTPPLATAGYLTSATWSPALGTHVGLGMLARGRERTGESVVVFHAGQRTRARVVSTCHYDPRGERLRG